MPTTDETRLRAALSDVDYPADKDALLAGAQRTGADTDTVRALRSIPPVSYADLTEVLRSVPQRHDDDAEPVNPIVEELGENARRWTT